MIMTENESRALKRLKRKLINEVTWIYISHLLLKHKSLTLSEIKSLLKKEYNIKINSVSLYTMIYRLLDDGLLEKTSDTPPKFKLSEYGRIQYKKGLVFIEEQLYLLKKDLGI